MSEEAKQILTQGRFNALWFVFIVFYLLVCSISGLYVVSLSNRTQLTIQKVKAAHVQKLLRERRLKGFAENKNFEGDEILYSESGSINPNLRHKASARNNEEGDVREYQRQLAEYRLQVAQERQKILEERRKQEEYEAKQRALIEQEKQEYLRAQQELKKSQNVAPETQQILGSSKTFTEPTTQSNTATRTSVNVKPSTPQKTQIGTLKKSKLGESSFQNQRF